MPESNVMQKLFEVFRGAIEETNRERQYFLEKLALYNKMGEALSDYLSELIDAASDLDGGKDTEECRESWRLLLTQQQVGLAALARTAERYRKTTVRLLEGIPRKSAKPRKTRRRPKA